MPTLKEIKSRIGSVQSTLKITSAMKLVSSAKLRKAQTAIENMRPYEAQLQRILSLVASGPAANPGVSVAENAPGVAIVAMASNSSLCGGFNTNAVGKVKELLKEYPGATVYSIGRKMADAMRKAGYPSPEDFTSLSEHPSYSPAAALAEKLMAEVGQGRLGKVYLVYNRFVSSARQVPVAEVLMAREGEEPLSSSGNEADTTDVILEPNARELLEVLWPKTLKLRLYAALLDSAAAEHAARTIAMQTATDNGEDLLDELTLQYNKGRQQKITSEILDLASGQQKQ